MVANKIYAVITGDLVKSAEFKLKRDKILSQLRKILKSAQRFETQKSEFIIFSEIFRGDSFQGILSNPAISLKVSLYIRAELLKILINKEQADARIGIGLGTVDSLNEKRIEASDGEAFRYSGQAVDTLKTFRRLIILSPSQELTQHFKVLATFLDFIIQRWSTEQAEAISLWFQGKTQETMSKILEITQPAVQQRLQTAGHFAIKEALEYFEALTNQYKLKSL
jgi:hypothetical protein